jgi:hypothetical protein
MKRAMREGGSEGRYVFWGGKVGGLKHFPAMMVPSGRSQWPRGIRHELSTLAQTLGSWVRMPFKASMSVCVYSVFVLFCVQVTAL